MASRVIGMRRESAFAAISLVMVASCSEPQSAPDGATVLQAMEIRTVLSDEPLFSIGGPAATGPAQFAGVGSLMVGLDGSIWLVDGQSQEIRIFDSDGTHLRTVGGRGSGPGEYQRAELAGRTSEGGFVVADGGAGRLTYLSDSGDLVRTERWVPGTRVDSPRIGPDGYLIGVTAPGIPISELGDGSFQDSMRVLRWPDLESEPDTIASVPGIRFATTPNRATRMPFTIQPGLLATTDALYVTAGSRLDVTRIAGESTERWSAGVESRPIDEQSRAALRRSVEASHSAEDAREVLETLAHPDLPTHLPGYDRLVETDDGLWARIWQVDDSAPSTWQVFDSAGLALGTVRTPPRFELFTVSQGRATGICRDEFDVEYLEQYSVVGG